VLFVHDKEVLEVPEDVDTVAAMSQALKVSVEDAFRYFFEDATEVVVGLALPHAR